MWPAGGTVVRCAVSSQGLDASKWGKAKPGVPQLSSKLEPMLI